MEGGREQRALGTDLSEEGRCDPIWDLASQQCLLLPVQLLLMSKHCNQLGKCLNGKHYHTGLPSGKLRKLRVYTKQLLR